ncbi:MAG: IPT/TIG domain-containing protein [Acidobacteria bacterium]|nr:IPT/TIG domain-containing protein [Acidobacteriota bacterium]
MPSSGPEAGGTAVTVTGSNFRSGMTARFGATSATNVLVVTPTTLTAVSPAGTGTVAVTLNNADNESAVLTSAFTYTPAIVAPTITSAQPTSGPLTGGNGVLLTGTGFQSGAAVTVGGAPAPGVIVTSGTQLTFTAPAAPAGAGPYAIVVTNPDAGAASFNSYTYLPQSTPTITDVSPASGPGTGGTTTVLTGTGFAVGATVTMCGQQVAPSSVSASSIVFATPTCGALGATTITVTNPDGGAASAPGGYTYTAAPSITSVSPARGTVNGGTTLTITGTGFQPGAGVLVDATAGTSVVVVSPTSILATTPAHPAGLVPVRVSNPDGGVATRANAYTYAVISTPDITAVSPASGTPGTVVTLGGSGFVDGATVTMCGVTATAGFVSAAQVTFAVPAACPPGAQDITLTNPDGGNDTIGGGFQVGAGTSTPTASSLSPVTGPTTGGTRVGITGSGFLNGATVQFGASPASSVVVVSSTLVVATSPAGAAGLVTVQVVNPDTGSALVPGGFTYVAQSTPIITGVLPAQGPTTGGVAVQISGAGFQPGAVVLLGGTPAQVTSITPDALSIITPACSAGPQSVTVTNPDNGTVTAAGAFTCVAVSQPSITSIAPGTGSVTGGTAVQVRGSGFQPGASVTIGTAPLTSVTVVSSTVITGTTGAHAAGTVSVTVRNPDGGTAMLAAAFTYGAGSCSRTATDADGDCLPDAWETDFGLDPTSGVCPDGPQCDPDGDGEDNGEELAGGTHPRGFHRQFFAEGVVSDLFSTQFHIVAPGQGGTPAKVQVRYMRQGGAVGQTASTLFEMARPSLRVVDPVQVLGAGSHEFATVVESDVQIAAARIVNWDGTSYGSHAEIGVATPSTTWHFAEGATIGGFNLFYLLSNPAATAATVTLNYLRPFPLAPVVRQHLVPARARVTVWVNQEAPELANEEISVTLTASHPVLAERAMYRHGDGHVFLSGHAAAGVTEPRATWTFAEGATGPYFDTFLLVANPHAEDVTIRVTYMLPDGSTRQETFVVGRQSRFNIWVDTRPGMADTAFSARIEVLGAKTVIAERAMWWPGAAGTWREGHVSAGAVVAGTQWVVSQGVDGGPENHETYVLVANVGPTVATVQVDLIAEDGATDTRTITIGAETRTNIAVRDAFPSMAGKRFGVVVTSLGTSPALLVVEGSTYNDAGTVRWEGGSSALGTRLR